MGNLSNKEIISEINFFLENKQHYTKEERRKIKEQFREVLKKMGDSLVSFIDKENKR